MKPVRAVHVAFNQTQMVVTDDKGRAWQRYDHTKIGQWRLGANHAPRH